MAAWGSRDLLSPPVKGCPLDLKILLLTRTVIGGPFAPFTSKTRLPCVLTNVSYLSFIAPEAHLTVGKR